MTSSASQLDRSITRAAAAHSAAGSASAPMTLYILLALASLPDAMVPPMLRDLFIVRYGVTEGAAHWFMAVNLIGAACVVPILARLRRTTAPTTLLAVAAAINGLLLALLAFPIGFTGSLVLRVVEGAADLVVFALLFDLIVKSGAAATRGRRLGMASALLMFSIGGGLALGGVIGERLPILVFVGGAVACLTVAVVACTSAGPIDTLERITQVPIARSTRLRVARQLWPTMSMAFADRAAAGLFIATVPLFFVSQLELSPSQSGGLLAVTMLVMAVSSWPAGVLSDRFGHFQVRIVAALCYAAAVLCIAGAAQMTVLMLVGVMAVIGLAGSALMPTSMALATRSGHGPVAIGALHASGNAGFFIGIVGSGVLLEVLRSGESNAAAFPIVIAALAALHISITIVTTVAIMLRTRRAGNHITNTATT